MTNDEATRLFSARLREEARRATLGVEPDELEPPKPPTDYGAGARPVVPQPADMNQLLRRAAWGPYTR